MLRTVALCGVVSLGALIGPAAMGQGLPARQAAAQPAVQGVPELVREQLGVSRYTLQTFEVPPENDGPWSFDIVLGGIAYAVIMEPHSIRSDHFEVIVIGEDGIHTRVEPPPIRTMKGEIIGLAGSTVRAAMVEGGVEVLVKLENGSTWGIQPLAHIDPRAPRGTHVVYSEADIVSSGGVCGGALIPPGQVDEEPPGMVLRGTANKICEIAVDSDVEFFNGRGSVANAVNDIEATMNAVETIYEINTGVTFEVTTVIVRTAEPDPYSSTVADTLLNQLGAEWGNSVYNPIRKDLVHLMTGKNMGGVLGIAWLSVVCSGNRYGLSRRLSNSIERYGVVAHEIGHNFSAPHCNTSCNPCQVMCAGLGGCSGVLTSFSSCEAGGIATYADNRPTSCLVAQPASIAPPFSESFASTTLNTSRWVYNKGAAITTGGVNEPSSPNSLELDATGSGLYEDDDIRTHFILMSGVSNPILRYSAQARGVPTGGQLIVEVWTNQLRWVVRNTITSDGVDDPNYTEYTHTLSGAELHNEFRVRFRTLVDSSSQNWFVDDVFVGSATGTTTGSCCVSGNCTVTTAANCSGQWTAGATCSPNPCTIPTGQCCISGNCTVTTQADCAGTWTEGGTCSINNCPVPSGACCFGTTCLILTEPQCTGSNGTFVGDGSTCVGGPCTLPMGACCFPDGTCVELTSADCTLFGGEYSGNDTTCTPGLCVPPTGACCDPGTGNCTIGTDVECSTAGGVFQGYGTSCGVGTCQPPTGACCVGSTCSVMTSAECTTAGGLFAGSGSVCNEAGNAVEPCCLSDFDQNNVVEVTDIFAFLNAWFALDPSANINGGVLDVGDIFDFLTAWFAGCGG